MKYLESYISASLLFQEISNISKKDFAKSRKNYSKRLYSTFESDNDGI